MTLEERIKRYADKGELTHLSLAYHDGKFHALLALASPPAGYTKAEHEDPIRALELMFGLAPVKVLPRKAPKEFTAAVTDEERDVDSRERYDADKAAERETLNKDWTTP